MKYIKTYEENTKYIDVDDNYCWLISGDKNEIIDIYKLFVAQLDSDLHITLDNNTLINGLTNSTFKIFGTYIYFDNKSRGALSYWTIYGDEDKKAADKYNKDNNFIFQGELKLINNKLFLDTLQRDANKYNL